jgi:hypothetical protein
MKLAVMQPTYLPWIGYFDLIDDSDVFVFHDATQFEKQSWQQRNRIKAGGELRWLSVPGLITGRSTQSIKEVEIVRPAAFPMKHVHQLEEHYRRAPYFNRYFPELRSILTNNALTLSQLNQTIIRWVSATLGLSPRFEMSSALQATGLRSDRLVNLCLELGATTYLSPLGSAAYLVQDYELFRQHGIEVVFQHYEHPVYRQLTEPFLPFASIVDTLFNEGDNTLALVRSGRRSSYSMDDVRQLLAATQTTEIASS